jgi:hypothetical protein
MVRVRIFSEFIGNGTNAPTIAERLTARVEKFVNSLGGGKLLSVTPVVAGVCLIYTVVYREE